MAQPARHLSVVGDHVIDDDGEVVTPADLQREVEKLRVDLKMAQRDVMRKNRLLAELERDRAQERIDYARREDVQRIATYWHRKCRPEDYARAKRRINPMSPERFDAVRGILDQERLVVVPGQKRRAREPVYSMEQCKAAIDGAAFDFFSKQRKNGTVEHFNDLELIFRDGKNFERFVARAPVPV
jgi:hypothetical protein